MDFSIAVASAEVASTLAQSLRFLSSCDVSARVNAIVCDGVCVCVCVCARARACAAYMGVGAANAKDFITAADRNHRHSDSTFLTPCTTMN